ncbi:hypothetical protein [Rhodoplanes roseus]|uniref:Uncharacterized protein n=1 Tax=Rhodoplanes roseus TaxID=29409 RepID=A0A327L310_9BRAD|nr:hypothetical protein [Rhodoplanes roseus]RAI45329.1 hypothetical protein CH341_04445 [Rhodoplanes roseus]
MRKTAPILAEVRKVIVREGTVLVSFVEFNSWYAVTVDLEAVIRQASDDRRPIVIATTTDAVVTAEFAPEP